MYNRAELRSSDHRPVFALFRTTVWVVDQAKRDALARLLLENVTSTSNGEKLDEKLAALTLHPSIDDREYFDSTLEFFDLTQRPVPPPSSEDNAWWDHPGTYHHISCRAFFFLLTGLPSTPEISIQQVTQMASLLLRKRKRRGTRRQTHSTHPRIPHYHLPLHYPMKSCTPRPCRTL